MSAIFENSISSIKDSLMVRAVNEAKALPESLLLRPTVDQTLEKIAERHAVPTAILRPAERSGKRRMEVRQKDDYGQVIEIEVPFIDVTIPFSGDSSAFEICPSHCEVIHENVIVRAGAITAPYLDDSSLENRVDTLMRRVSQNLNALREEAKNFPSEIKEVLRRVVAERITQIRAQQDRDKGRSFPIS